MSVKLPPPSPTKFRAECAALLQWVRTGDVAQGHDPREFLRTMLDVLYRGKPPEASLNTVDRDTPLTIVLNAGMARLHLEAREPVPVPQLAALGNIDRGHLGFLIRNGELRRSQAARSSPTGRMMDAPIVPSDARKWLGWDAAPAAAAAPETSDEPKRKANRG